LNKLASRTRWPKFYGEAAVAEFPLEAARYEKGTAPYE